MISIIDYGIGNVASIANMLTKIGVKVQLVSSVNDIESSQKLILPGVGSFDAGIKTLSAQGFDDAITKAVENGAYLLGICLGMQMLLDSSEEGSLKGLSLIEGRASKFDRRGLDIKIPHMGWNVVNPTSNSSLFDRSFTEHRYYFVHSYFVKCNDFHNEVAYASHGADFCCAVQKDRVMGVQFHPEKSHKFGMRMFEKYSDLPC